VKSSCELQAEPEFTQRQRKRKVAAEPAEVKIFGCVIIDRQLLRFVAPNEALGLRLTVVNQQGELIFDSGFIAGPVLE